MCDSQHLLHPSGLDCEKTEEPRIGGSILGSECRYTPWEMEEMGFIRQHIVSGLQGAFGRLEEDVVEAFKRADAET